MAERATFDFLNQYKTISNKLKKRFLRKTNATEPSDQFAFLAAQCERSDLPQYAGLSWLAVAKCESSLSHINEEGIALVKAGRLSFEAEKRNIIGCDEHLKGGLSSLSQVEKLWEKENPLVAALCLETGNTMKKFSDHYSVLYFSKACDLLKNSPPLHLQALGKLASGKINIGDFHGALSVFTEMLNVIGKISAVPFGIYNDILIRCEISRVLLILLLQPTPQKIAPDLAKFVEKYTWIGEPDPDTISWLGEDLFFLLQSLVMSCQCQDLEAVYDLESELWNYFNSEQNRLLHTIIININNIDK